jgi:hypothetical protein
MVEKMNESSEAVTLFCPHCKGSLDPNEIAIRLPPSVLASARARRNAGLQRRHAGPGRPRGAARCPGCDELFLLDELRTHRLPCLTRKLAAWGQRHERVHLRPMDATEYPDFYVEGVTDEHLRLTKASNHQCLELPLGSVAGIVVGGNAKPGIIRLRGQVKWNPTIDARGLWEYSPDLLRPRRSVELPK